LVDKIRASSVNLSYKVTGSGPRKVVFINGLTMSLEGWYNQVPEFSKKYTVLTYDCRGQGSSDKPDSDYSQKIHADDLYELLKNTGFDNASIIGLSNGGMIALHLALKYPKLPDALVLVDTCSHIERQLELMIDSWIKTSHIGGNQLRYDVSLPLIFSDDFLQNNMDLIETMRESSIKINSPKAVINLALATKEHDVRKELSNINVPTLIIVGDEDILIPIKYSMYLHDNIQNSDMVIIENCGHVPPIEQPQRFNEIVINFLGNVYSSKK